MLQSIPYSITNTAWRILNTVLVILGCVDVSVTVTGRIFITLGEIIYSF